MENKWENWGLQRKTELKTTSSSSSISIRGILNTLKENLDESDHRPTIPLGHGDPSPFPCFRTTPVAEDAIIDAVRSNNFNFHAPPAGILPARRAIAEYLSKDLSYQLSPNDVYVTLGCKQAIEVIVSVLARPGANILLPKPGFPRYIEQAVYNNIEVRHFNLLPEKGWEVDLDGVEAIANESTVAMVIINPGNPCGSVYTYQHLQKVAETASKLGILVIADEVYGHLAFGTNRFVPMGVFSSIVPVITLGSISKRWIVPGWRLGWLVINDPKGVLTESGIIRSIESYISISPGPPTFIQGAVPQILQKTEAGFFSRINTILREGAEICNDRINKISCITCPYKPEGSMFVMVKLDLSLLQDIKDDIDFCVKLAKEESVVVLPGISLGLKNWIRITYAIELSYLEDGLERIKEFCQRHAK